MKQDRKSITTEDLKATLHMYQLNRRNIKAEFAADIHSNALECANELESRIGPNAYSASVKDGKVYA